MTSRQKVTIGTLRTRKREGRRISMLTCYDFATARLMEEAGIDSLLIGDTYAEVCLGHNNTLPATVDHMVTLAAAVKRGAPSAYLVGDMPFLSYQVSHKDAILNAGKFLVDGCCDCVKVEVDRKLAGVVEAMATASIPVMAHLGLRPQSIQSIGGYKVQGRRAVHAMSLIEDAQMMERAGAVALLLEAIPIEVARVITESTELPVIGIACGPHCDGQVLVVHDMLGYSTGHPPRSVKQYAQLAPIMVEAFRAYSSEVSSGSFPSSAQCFTMEPAEWVELERLRKSARREES